MAVLLPCSRDQAGQALADFCMDVGGPDQIVTDLAGKLSGPETDFVKIARRYHIRIHWAEKERHKQNHWAEHEIGILQQCWR